MKKIRIGSRESRLAVIQSELLRDWLAKRGIEAEIITMKTTGDRILDRRLDQIGGKGLFVKELDIALAEKRTDLSVHSLKDLPAEVPDSLPVLGYSRREDPRDALILPEGATEIDRAKPIGSASLRRGIQLAELYPDVEIAPVRGNVQTRLRKLDEGAYGAIVLAAAGLHRLGLKNRISRYFEPEEILPAAGQGILAIQGRAGEDYSFLKGFFDRTAAAEAEAERAFIRTLDGGCSSPVAAHAVCEGDEICLTGLYYRDEDGSWFKETATGKADRAEELGAALARRMRES